MDRHRTDAASGPHARSVGGARPVAGSKRRATAALLTAMGLAVAMPPASASAAEPVDGGSLVLYPVTINNSSGDQYDPHVYGDLAVYTADNTIHYYDFSDGTEVQVPAPADATDRLSDVSNGRIAFSREEASGRSPIMVFDTAAPLTPAIEVDPQSLPLRNSGAIGWNTVAFIDHGLTPGGELVAADLGGATYRVTNDTRIDARPSVAPLGNLVVFQSCQTSVANCDVRQAGWNGTAWVVASLTTTSEHEANPDSDGVIVVYDANRAGEREIYWQPVGGGAENVISVAGVQRNPSVSAGVIAFESVAVGDTAADLFVYEVASNRVFRVTDTPADDSLNDIFVLPNGDVRVVWASGVTGSRDVFGATFGIPPVQPPAYTFGGFVQPVDARPTLNAMKAGAAVPVKFSLGGDYGLDIFTAGYPKSQVMTCDSLADVDGVEQTVSAGSSSLGYDSATGLYTYVWKTDKSWAGTCRQLVLAFDDGSFQRANFRLK